jgi:hypothetical protein
VTGAKLGYLYLYPNSQQTRAGAVYCQTAGLRAGPSYEIGGTVTRKDSQQHLLMGEYFNTARNGLDMQCRKGFLVP